MQLKITKLLKQGLYHLRMGDSVLALSYLKKAEQLSVMQQLKQIKQAIALVRKNIDMLPANYNVVYFNRGLNFIEQRVNTGLKMGR